MFLRKRLLRRMNARQVELAGYMQEYHRKGIRPPLHTEGMYDEVNRWIGILERRS